MIQSKADTMLRSILAALCPKSKPSIEFDEPLGLFDIQVSAEDHGRLIGKNGATVWAVSALMQHAGFRIHVTNPEERSNRQPSLFEPRKDWDRKVITNLVRDIGVACIPGAPQPWVMEETGDSEATLHMELSMQDAVRLSDQDFVKAITAVLHAAGMAAGVVIKTEASWR